MLDAILRKTSSIWFIPGLVLTVIASMLVVAAIKDTMPRPRTITGHAMAPTVTITDTHGLKVTETTRGFDTMRLGGDPTHVWIAVVTSTGEPLGCRVDQTDLKDIDTVHDTTIRCDDSM